MASQTHVGAGLPDLVTRLHGLITADMMADFNRLNTFVLQAGPEGFDAAQWLEDVVSDRRAGLIAHATLLQATFGSLADAIGDAAKAIAGADGDAAAGLDAIRAWLASSDPTLLPPVVHAYGSGRTSYDSGDTGGDPQLLYGVTAGGDHVVKDGGVAIDLPKKAGASAPDLYQDIFNELPKKPGSSAVSAPPEFMFLPNEYVVK